MQSVAISIWCACYAVADTHLDHLVGDHVDHRAVRLSILKILHTSVCGCDPFVLVDHIQRAANAFAWN